MIPNGTFKQARDYFVFQKIVGGKYNLFRIGTNGLKKIKGSKKIINF